MLLRIYRGSGTTKRQTQVAHVAHKRCTTWPHKAARCAYLMRNGGMAEEPSYTRGVRRLLAQQKECQHFFQEMMDPNGCQHQVCPYHGAARFATKFADVDAENLGYKAALPMYASQAPTQQPTQHPNLPAQQPQHSPSRLINHPAPHTPTTAAPSPWPGNLNPTYSPPHLPTQQPQQHPIPQNPAPPPPLNCPAALLATQASRLPQP